MASKGQKFKKYTLAQKEEVLAKYIEGYSGHADQAGLLHFVDSFVKKPNHIFLVHGEEESQKALRDKINENFDLPVSIPDYCESFDLTNTVQATGNIRKRNLNEYKKLEVIDRMETLKEELVDMESIVKEDILANTVNDDEISKLNERIKELEKQIVEIVENK